MKIKVLGTRGEIEASAPGHEKHSGVLVDGKILLDLGEKEYLDCAPEAVFITHLHPDHAFFVTSPAPVSGRVYAPEESRYGGSIAALEGPVEIGRCRVTPVPTHHSKLVKSSAYLVEEGGLRLLYTGDVIWINKEHHNLLEKLDLVITDGSYMRKGGMIRRDRETGQLYGHAGIPNLIELFKPFTRNMLFVHFGTWFFKDIEAARRGLEELGRQNGINVYTGYDGMELDIAALENQAGGTWGGVL